jgi:hypothetical protein
MPTNPAARVGNQQLVRQVIEPGSHVESDVADQDTPLWWLRANALNDSQKSALAVHLADDALRVWIGPKVENRVCKGSRWSFARLSFSSMPCSEGRPTR